MEKDTRLATLSAELADEMAKRIAIEAELAALQAKLAARQAELATASAKAEAGVQRVTAMEGSTSWRVTAPLRAMAAKLKGA
jgi:hypothetical protein